MTLLIACVLAYWLMRHGPQLVAEAFAEVEYARRGELSPAALARIRRLEAAGIDPAAGGAARQFFGNWWRDAWLDADEARRQRRTGVLAGSADTSWWRRFRARLDDAVTEHAERWRNRTADGAPPSAPGHAGAPSPEGDQPAPAAAGRAVDDDPPVVHSDTTYQARPADPGPPPHTVDEPTPEPIRVAATVGDPIRTPQHNGSTQRALEGAVMTQAVARGGEVTGVVSGAGESRAIQRAIEAAVGEFVTAMARVRQRINTLGEQTLSTVQMSAQSDVVQNLAAAAEAAAAAQAQAKACGNETAPLMGAVARAFDRRNS